MVMFYFSGTGNSRFIAEKFSSKMSCECHSIEETISFRELIRQNKVVAFCYPVYGSRVPAIMRGFVRTHRKELGGKKLIIFCTQLLFSGDGARAFSDLLPERHCRFIYAEHFSMPNNICNFPLLPITSRRHNMKRMTRAEKKLQSICEDIRAGRVRLRGFHFFSRMLGLLQGAFWPSMEKSMGSRIQIDMSCNKCGLCTRLCPAGNLKMEDGIVCTKDKCICCYRCMNKCPQKAIYGLFGKKVKRQYKGLNRM